jgi:hypothetical protein
MRTGFTFCSPNRRDRLARRRATRERLSTRTAQNENSPGRCGRLAPAHPPGATQKVERSTTGRSSGVSLRLDLFTSPVVVPRRGLGGRCPFSASRSGEPVPAAFGRHPRANPAATAAPTPSAGCPTSVTGVEARSVGRTRLRCLLGARSVSRSRCRPDPVGRRTGLRCRRPPTSVPADADPVAGVGSSVTGRTRLRRLHRRRSR